jgi:hypothetical protein
MRRKKGLKKLSRRCFSLKSANTKDSANFAQILEDLKAEKSFICLKQ